MTVPTHTAAEAHHHRSPAHSPPPHRHRRTPARSPPCHRRSRAPQQLRGLLVDIIAKTTTGIRIWPSPQPRLRARDGHAISPLPRMALIAPPLVLYTAVIAVTVTYLRIAFIRSCRISWINFSSREEKIILHSHENKNGSQMNTCALLFCVGTYTTSNTMSRSMTI